MTPKISIITVTYNAEAYLIPTLENIIGQDYPNKELVLVDGKSKDGTLKIIDKYKSHIHKFVSEKDKGLYDAMNKGLKLATGDFVIFINAGDVFANTTIISQCFANISPETDVVYGKTMMVAEDGSPLGLRGDITTRKLPDALNWKSLRYGMVVCHQSIFVRRSIAPNYLMQNLSADIDWVIGSLKKSRHTLNTGIIVSHFLVGGISKQKHWESLKDRFTVLKNHYGLISTIFAHAAIILRAFVFQITKIGKTKYS